MLKDRRQSWLPKEIPFQSSNMGKPQKAPNIIFILADDLGWGDVGCYGSLQNLTPAIDSLAADGLRFNHGYSGSATCSPTRVSLYTGRYPGRTFVGLAEPIITEDDKTGIPAEHPTLPQMMKDNGYRTAMFGKWHVGHLPWFSPNKIGFEKWFGNLSGAVDYFSHLDLVGKKDLYEDEVPIESDRYYTELITERAVAYIENHDKSKPFYLQVNYTAPHWPWEGPEDRHISDRVTEAMKKNPLSALFHYEGGSLATYQKMVKALDDGVKQILDSLEAQKITDDTLVIFSSDNGGERYAFMWPFVGEKGVLTEGGIRVPLIMRWPGFIKPGQVTEKPAVTMDITATMLDLAGAEIDANYPLDGKSLIPWLVENQDLPDRYLRWRIREQGAIRKGKFKLLVEQNPKFRFGRRNNGPLVQLFDVTEDGREAADLSEEYPEIKADLLAEWERFNAELMEYPPRVFPPNAAGGAAPGQTRAD